MPELSQRLFTLFRYIFISLTAASVSASMIIGLSDEIKVRLRAQNSLSMLNTPTYDSEIVSDLIYDEIYFESEQAHREEFGADTAISDESLTVPSDGEIKQVKYEQVDLSAPPFSLINQTSYNPNLPSLIAKNEQSMPVYYISHSERTKFAASSPLVLIYHTHGTEAFAECEEGNYRSDDTDKNIVAVGRVLADALNEAGIPAIHCETMHDFESYNESYERSGKTVGEYLKKYPSIKYVLDVHRDGLERADGTVMVPVSTTYGTESAQMMIVVGSDENGADHPNWQDNLSFALMLQSEMYSLNASSIRAINLRASSFHQQCSPGALLLEIGSNGNTLDQAKNAAELCARALSAVIKEKESTNP